jgi:hypothetical protein
MKTPRGGGKIMNAFIKSAMLAGLALTLSAQASSLGASTFSPWQVANVPWGDILNVRAFPASTSQKQAAYPNGTVLAMTGRCTDNLNLFDIAHLPHGQQGQAVRFRWCEVWHDPRRDGDFVTGWVYGRYIAPH